jgi:hypothetical protein
MDSDYNKMLIVSFMRFDIFLEDEYFVKSTEYRVHAQDATKIELFFVNGAHDSIVG